MKDKLVTRGQLSSLTLTYQSWALKCPPEIYGTWFSYVDTHSLWDQLSPVAQFLANQQHNVLLLQIDSCILHWEQRLFGGPEWNHVCLQGSILCCLNALTALYLSRKPLKFTLRFTIILHNGWKMTFDRKVCEGTSNYSPQSINMTPPSNCFRPIPV